MGKLIVCFVAAALGIQAQPDVKSSLERVTVGPPMRATLPHFSATPLAPPSGTDSAAGAFTTPSGIVYTCDPSINTASPTACNTLNTTIAALYNSAFTNANASIYITLGDTDAGESQWIYDEMTYSNFRKALVASETSANDMTAVADSLPAVSPFGADLVGLQTALQRALGFSIVGQSGVKANGVTSCSLGTSGCYDGVITISNTLPLYFRSGTISGSQYDFFSIAEHETDEILGTASCLFCPDGGIVLPPDFFRYHSNGSRSFAVGSNDPCSSSDATNACFSLDSTHMLQQYNNLDNGEDAGDWLANCAAPLVQDATICPGTAGVDISPAAEILVLDVVGYTLVGASGSAMVTNVTSSTANGTYGVGDSISVQITFSEAVTVTGVPQLALNSGGTANYSSGSGTSALVFTYIVAAGQSSALLDYSSTGALTLNGGAIKGPGGSAAALTLAAPGASGSLSHGADIVVNTSPTQVTIQTSPNALQFSVDGGAAQISPKTLSLTQGSHTIAVAATQSGGAGIQYVFTSWSDGGAASHSIAVGVASPTFTANFKTQFELTISAAPAAGGTVSPGSGVFYDSETVVAVTGTANAGYGFSGWSGSVASPSSTSTTVTMSGPVTVTANFSVSLPPPAPVSIGPGAGSGFTQAFTFSFNDPAGYADLSVVDILIGSYLDGIGACYVALVPSGAASGYVYLVDDAGDGGYVSGTPMLLPSGGNLSNSQCTVNGSGSSVSGSGATLSLTLNITFAPAFAGNKVFYTAARSSTQNSGWEALGTWNVPGSTPVGPGVGFVTPGRSVSMDQTYTFTFTDTKGYSDLSVVDILTNSFLDGISACYVAYVPTSASTGYLYLVDDAGDGGYAPGSPLSLASGGTLQNSQCAINTAASSASAGGDTLNLNLAITFTSSFAGNQVFYLASRNNTTGNSGWQAVGSVTVP
jgi:hypothetical protein